jgi:uncharacterized protein (TIGR01619 family)
VGRACQATPCGRITTEGRREFYFYGETKSGFSQAVEAALQGFEGYRYDTGCQDDSEWGQYLNVLYPSPEDLQRIANMDLLDVLLKKGDVLTVAREVQHGIYFRSEASQSSFRDTAISAGVKIVSEPTAKGELPFGIVVARTQSIEQNTIDRTVLELFNLARRVDGDYDGWETPVVTQKG